MQAIIICPDGPADVPVLTHKFPVALAPALGETLLGHRLSHLASLGATQVKVLAADRPELIRAYVGHGERWGLNVSVVPERRVLTVEEAREKYRLRGAKDWLKVGEDVVIADRPSALTESPLGSARDWFHALRERMPEARERNLGVRQIQPGVWAGLNCRIDPGVQLTRPCWLGENVWVRTGAKVGPNAFVENDALIDHDAEVAESWIGPKTYVGAMTHVFASLAWGRALLNWDTGSFMRITDDFLLSDLDTPATRPTGSWLGRIAALLVGMLTAPFVLFAWWLTRQAGNPASLLKRALRPDANEVRYREWPSLGGLWQRWPQLWNIVRGEFCWVGNRPLNRAQAGRLTSEFEKLWLTVPPGLFSLADAEGCPEGFTAEARVHSSFYAAQACPRLDRQILFRVLKSLLKNILTNQPTPAYHETKAN